LKKELTTRFNVKTGSDTSKKGEEYKAEEEYNDELDQQ
jgi:hypothetical protein